MDFQSTVDVDQLTVTDTTLDSAVVFRDVTNIDTSLSVLPRTAASDLSFFGDTATGWPERRRSGTRGR
ncbi:MAG: hypothetical protein U5R48_14890 [Gammaproteobacteria bacterium]|nr:hypothetical protein [Gammaproteobacteria bacterium]